MVVVQVPSTSKGSDAVDTSRPAAESSKTAQALRNLSSRAEENQRRAVGTSTVLALRDGEALPSGYRYVSREPHIPIVGHQSTSGNRPVTVDLCTPPNGGATETVSDVEAGKRAAAARRNAVRSSNKQANATFVKEAKESLASGRPPVLKVSEGKTHLKTRWQAAAKEVAYKFLDLRKQSWKSYSHFEKAKVHKELDAVYKFDPPLDPIEVEKYLASHLRSARAVWKAHWLRYGPDNKHFNCPEEAWQSLTKWWSTPECEEEATEMAERRSRVQKGSKTGRKALVERMDEVGRITLTMNNTSICHRILLCKAALESGNWLVYSSCHQ